jgi:hypothetical protein
VADDELGGIAPDVLPGTGAPHGGRIGWLDGT